MIRVAEAKLVRDFVVWVRFTDGTQGEVDLSTELEGPIFEPLKDPGVFAQLRVHPELHTLVWPKGADLAPEFLYQQVRVAA